jgi:hypothetical protein
MEDDFEFFRIDFESFFLGIPRRRKKKIRRKKK